MSVIFAIQKVVQNIWYLIYNWFIRMAREIPVVYPYVNPHGNECYV